MKRKKFMTIIAIFAILCAAIVFTGCPQANQNKSTSSTTEKEKEKEKDKEKDKEKEEEDDEDTSYAPFTGKNDKTIWKRTDKRNDYEEEDENGNEKVYQYYYYAEKGTIYAVIYDSEKNKVIRIPNVGKVTKSKITLDEEFKDTKKYRKLFKLDFNEKDTVSVKIVDSTLLIDKDDRVRTYTKVTTRDVYVAIQKYYKN